MSALPAPPPPPTPTPTPTPTPAPTSTPCVLSINGPDTVLAGNTYAFSVTTTVHSITRCTAVIISGNSKSISWVQQQPKIWEGLIATTLDDRGSTMRLDAEDAGGCRDIKDVDIV